MSDRQNAKLELFVSNAQTIRDDFTFHSILSKWIAALLYAAQDRPIDCGAVRESYGLIKQNTGLFSAFRGDSAMAISAMLALSPDRDARIREMISAYEELKRDGFWSSDYLTLSAYMLATNARPEQRTQAIARMRAFYEGMKRQHWLLTGMDDYIFCAMLSASDVDVDDGLVRMETLYQRLKPVLSSGNGVQALAQLLVLCGETWEQTIDRLLAIREALRARKLRLDRAPMMSSLGILAVLPKAEGVSEAAHAEALADEIAQALEWMNRQKRYGRWMTDRGQMLLFASSLTALSRLDEARLGAVTAALSTSITNIILAQQATMAAICASTAVTAAGRSSSSST